jgi:ketosteroid isomerase-like protein
VDASDVDRWLDAYLAAWRTYDPPQIAALFSDDVAYRYHPYDEAIRGRDEVVQSWLGDGEQAGASTRDPAGTYDASYRTIAVDGDVAVATGSSTYRAAPGGPIDRVYDNCFVMRFDAAGQCCEFTEWYVRRP